MAFTDSHTHLTLDAFDADRDAVIARAREALRYVCTIGSLARDAEAARDLSERHDFLYWTAGLHPHDAKLWEPDSAARLESLARHPRLLAIGEIGLDYHYDHSPRDRQREVFAEQIRLARRLRLPIVIHTREAHDDTLRILDVEKAEEVGGVFHCFSGNAEMARFAVDHGFRISFSGSLTFKNAEELREVARSVPPERLLTETDAPFLSPHPHRGKRNEPARVLEVVTKLAELHAMSPQTMGDLTTRNFEQAFPRLQAS
ncbi:MAG TPA: TatD family hydrolase [Candidatus Polarisedimenticolia bacterium]|jgi:TatD DNase family protein|nr:TatD family hydrolase [Candidatus Polarisedimenticolia bacterium]